MDMDEWLNRQRDYKTFLRSFVENLNVAQPYDPRKMMRAMEEDMRETARELKERQPACEHERLVWLIPIMVEPG